MFLFYNSPSNAVENELSTHVDGEKVSFLTKGRFGTKVTLTEPVTFSTLIEKKKTACDSVMVALRENRPNNAF
jgi:hypothetical protein